MSNAQSKPNPKSFLHLPLEVRYIIYEFYLTDVLVVPIGKEVHRNIVKLQRIVPYYKNSVSLLQTSSQIRDESKNTVFSHATLCFNFPCRADRISERVRREFIGDALPKTCSIKPDVALDALNPDAASRVTSVCLLQLPVFFRNDSKDSLNLSASLVAQLPNIRRLSVKTPVTHWDLGDCPGMHRKIVRLTTNFPNLERLDLCYDVELAGEESRHIRRIELEELMSDYLQLEAGLLSDEYEEEFASEYILFTISWAIRGGVGVNDVTETNRKETWGLRSHLHVSWQESRYAINVSDSPFRQVEESDRSRRGLRSRTYRNQSCKATAVP